MSFIRVGSLRALPPGEIMEVTLGEATYAICNAGGHLYAVDGLCPHRDGPLAQGALHGHTVVCPWHAWEWDCRTGRSLQYPDQSLASYEVKAEGDDILLQVSSGA